MKKILYTILFVFILNSYVYAGVKKLWGGALFSYTIHEASHVVASNLTNNSTRWDSGNLTIETDDKSDATFILSAGLTSHLITSEVILQTDKINNNDDFVRGMMIANLVIPLRYAVDYWFLNSLNRNTNGSFSGDIQGIEYYHDKKTANYFAGAVFAITCYQGYRFYNTQSWVKNKTKNKGSDIFIEPTQAGGFIITFRRRF